jgi:transcriptional regulator with XRE-family HTH domain
MADDKTFSEVMRNWRTQKGYSQQRLAELLEEKARPQEVTAHLVGKIELGQRDAQQWFVIAFANLSGQNVNRLLRAAGWPEIEKAAMPS